LLDQSGRGTSFQWPGQHAWVVKTLCSGDWSTSSEVVGAPRRKCSGDLAQVAQAPHLRCSGHFTRVVGVPNPGTSPGWSRHLTEVVRVPQPDGRGTSPEARTYIQGQRACNYYRHQNAGVLLFLELTQTLQVFPCLRFAFLEPLVVVAIAGF
jgi:hypothetical protein